MVPHGDFISTGNDQPVPAMPAKRSRNPGCDYLARLHPHPADDEDMIFSESTHTYTYHGVQVEKSCTKLVNENFPVFDAWGTVSKFYGNWRRSQDTRYWDIIGCTEDESDDVKIDDSEAQRRIVARWETLAAEASRKGALLHLYCERLFNLPTGDPPLDMTDFAEVMQEVVQHQAFMHSGFVAEHSLEAYATEMLVWYTINGQVVSAGQIDAVMRSRDTGFFDRLEARQE
jgi:hypothetical protein